MLNLHNHKRNANQNYTEIPFHPSQNDYHEENNEQQSLVRMWGKGTLIHCQWECKLVQPLCK
jgi:hypothetical protein